MEPSVNAAEVPAATMPCVEIVKALLAFQQGNLDAFVEAGRIVATGAQSIAEQAAAQMERRMADAVTTWQALPPVPCLHAIALFQAHRARSLMDAWTEAASLNQASLQLAEQAFAPLAGRAAAAAEMLAPPHVPH